MHTVIVHCRGKQHNILIIEPTSSAWMYVAPKTRRVTGYRQPFPAIHYHARKAQVEYDLGCENIILDHGKTEGKN